MYHRFVSVVILSIGLVACAQKSAQQTEMSQHPEQPPVSEKCQQAKQDLEKAVEAGQRNDLHELKRNIELYCVWRRY